MAIRADFPDPEPRGNAGYEGGVLVDPIEEMRVFDNLPPVVREAVRTRRDKYEVASIAKLVFLYGGHEIARRIRSQLPGDPNVRRKGLANRRLLR